MQPGCCLHVGVHRAPLALAMREGHAHVQAPEQDLPRIHLRRHGLRPGTVSSRAWSLSMGSGLAWQASRATWAGAAGRESLRRLSKCPNEACSGSTQRECTGLGIGIRCLRPRWWDLEQAAGCMRAFAGAAHCPSIKDMQDKQIDEIGHHRMAAALLLRACHCHPGGGRTLLGGQAQAWGSRLQPAATSPASGSGSQGCLQAPQYSLHVAGHQ